MDIHFYSEEFKQLLHKYEELQNNNISEFLDSEELTDIAEYYCTIGKEDKALEAVNYANHLYPTATEPLVFKARMALLIHNDVSLSNEIAETIVDKSDSDYMYLKAEIMIVNHQVSLADQYLQEQYEKLIDVDSKDEFIIDSAALFSDYEEIDYAEKWLNRTRNIDNDDYKEIKVRILKGRGKYKEGETLLNKLIDKNPYSCNYWNQLAQIQFLNNDIQGAITSSEYSIAINPNDEDALLNKANGLFSLDNFKESLKYYQLYKQTCHNADISVIDVTIGHIYLILGYPIEAQDSYQQAIAESFNKDSTLINVGISIFDNGYFKIAYNLFTLLLPKVGKDWTEGFAYLARCCYELNKTEEYKQYLQLAIERNPVECQDVLSDLYPQGMAIKDYPSINI